MINPQDYETLKRVTGLDEVPEDLEQEYEIWLNCFHRDGNSGPLGSIGCIAVARSMGYKPPPRPGVPAVVDWRKYPHDGSTRVAVKVRGQWEEGVFLGFVEAGTLAVRLDADPEVREYKRSVVRLAGAQHEEEAQPQQEEDDDFTIDLTENEPEAAEAEKGVIQTKKAVSSSK